MSDIITNSINDQSFSLKNDNKFIGRFPNNFDLRLFGSENNMLGRLHEVDGKLFFDGNIDESAKLFFEHVIKLYKQ